MVKFSVRIAPGTRAAIELEAREVGLPESRVAESLIKRGLKSKRDAARNDATRAISYLLGELAEIIAPPHRSTEKFNFEWRTDPFLFEAFKLSFTKLMDAIRPEGEPISPSQRDARLKNTTFGGPLDSIDARASYAATILLHNLNASQTPPDFSEEIPEKVKARLESTSYALQDAWIGLNKGKSK